MIIKVLNSTIIQPFEESPKRILWTSNVDQLFKMHTPSVYFYKPDGSSDFFNANVLKDALSKVLVPFYPIAGRLIEDDDSRRIVINCNGDGVLFVEASTDSVLDDLGDFTPSMELRKLIPNVDDGMDIFECPRLLLQVTYFKCGGVSLGVGLEHTVADGMAGTHFTNSWSEIARGLDLKLVPFIERTLLRARASPTRLFPHIEHQPSPTMHTNSNSNATAILKISKEQINLLKAQCQERPSPIKYSSYLVLAAHIWCCACRARGLEDDQETKLSIATDGRSRLHPPLPSGYFGNAIFHMTPMAKSGEVVSRPLVYTVQKIQDTISRANDEYIRSALDYLELQPNLKALVRGPHTFRCPNMAVTSWCRLPIYDADFGWGRPIFVGPGSVLYEGLGYLIPSPTNDGSVSLAISLLADHMARFRKYFCDI